MAITTAYKVGLKHQIIEALKAVFDNSLPDPRYQNIYVGLEYPLTQEKFPAIFVTYNEGPLQNVGVGSLDLVTDALGNKTQVKHFRFTGQLNFNVIALNPVDRDNLSAILLNLLALGSNMPEFAGFSDKVDDGQYISLTLMTDVITPGGEQVAAVPWQSSDELLYTNTYSIAVFGEFWSDPSTGDLIEIDTINLYPYLVGQPDPRPW